MEYLSALETVNLLITTYQKLLLKESSSRSKFFYNMFIEDLEEIKSKLSK